MFAIVDALLFKIVVDLGLAVADIAHIRCVTKGAADLCTGLTDVFVSSFLTFRPSLLDENRKNLYNYACICCRNERRQGIYFTKMFKAQTHCCIVAGLLRLWAAKNLPAVI